MQKLLKISFLAIIFVISFFSKISFGAENLIPNPSLETSQLSSPNNWGEGGKWGENNPQYIYKDTGQEGSHSIYINMTSWKSGDAKWYFEPIDVSADSDYVFSDYYMSNVSTSLVVMSLDSNKNPTYFDISTSVPIANTWKKNLVTFHTLPNTKSLTVFHLIKKNGWLATDNYTISLKPKVITNVVDNVPNNSLEIISLNNPNLPDQWSGTSWGSNTPIFEYVNDGHDGTRSVKLTMTNYISGDAEWDYAPQPLTKGKDYKFTAWYKTDTVPHVVAHYIKNNGTEDYFGLPDPLPKGNDWQEYSGVFSVPQDVKAVSVYFFLSNNGTLQVDDFHIKPYKYLGFNRPIVTLTFDDAFENNVNNALPVLDKYGIKVTYCYSTKYVENQAGQDKTVLKISQSGNETCSHSVNHQDLTTLSSEDIDYELSHSQNYLSSLVGQNITAFIEPFGAYNSVVLTEIKKYYAASRSTDEGFNSKDNLDPYRLQVQNMKYDTTVAQFKKWVNKAKSDNTWLIIVYHEITNGAGTEFDTKKSDFDAEMQWLSKANITVERLDQALNEVKSQK